MASDFAVIFDEGQHFGDHEGMYEKQDPSVRFVGVEEKYAFETPGAKGTAVLMFTSFGVSFNTNILTVNGHAIAGGLVPSVDREWHSRVLVVPADTLKASGANELGLATRTRSGATDGNLDDFIVANMVVMYHHD